MLLFQKITTFWLFSCERNRKTWNLSEKSVSKSSWIPSSVGTMCVCVCACMYMCISAQIHIFIPSLSIPSLHSLSRASTRTSRYKKIRACCPNTRHFDLSTSLSASAILLPIVLCLFRPPRPARSGVTGAGGPFVNMAAASCRLPLVGVVLGLGVFLSPFSPLVYSYLLASHFFDFFIVMFLILPPFCCLSVIRSQFFFLLLLIHSSCLPPGHREFYLGYFSFSSSSLTPFSHHVLCNSECS